MLSGNSPGCWEFCCLSHRLAVFALDGLSVSERKTSLRVPEAYLPLLEDIRLLKSDDQNPNKMTIKQKGEVWRSLQKHGWIYPIVTDLEGVFSDGEQRVQVCKEHNEFFAPVLRLTLSDAQRRILRQTLNKLHGKHSRRRARQRKTATRESLNMSARKMVYSISENVNSQDQ